MALECLRFAADGLRAWLLSGIAVHSVWLGWPAVGAMTLRWISISSAPA